MYKNRILFNVFFLFVCFAFFNCSRKDVRQTNSETISAKTSNDTINKTNSIDSIKQKLVVTKEVIFPEFAKEFIDNGINSLEGLKFYSESKIQSYDFDINEFTKKSVSKTYNFLKYYFKFKKFKIKKSSIDFTDGELTVHLYFRKNKEGKWKFYKYDGVC